MGGPIVLCTVGGIPDWSAGITAPYLKGVSVQGITVPG